jgi:hypothetical protein
VIEQGIVGWGTGVRMGEGSLYDVLVEEILAEGEGPLDSVAEDYVEWAMQFLATARAERRRSTTLTVEAAFEAAHRQQRRRRRS